MIVDAHLHVWRAVPDYPQPSSTTVSAVCDVPWELFAEYRAEHGIERAVLVQPLYPGEDNSYVADCAARDPARIAAVCVVDPRQANAAEKLEYWVRERGCRGLRLRPRVPAEAECFGRPECDALWESARRLGIVVNVLAGPEHLPAVSSLAERFPEVPIALDHFGNPNLKSGDAQGLLDLARHPRVFVKVSGYYYFSSQPYPHPDAVELFRLVRDRFGSERLMWGSDFPHVLLKLGYRRALLWLERACGSLSDADRELILGRNAQRLYWPNG